MNDYKKEPGGKEKLKERNPKWINDDYVKFLRYGQHFIEKNGSGVLAFINPHGFLDNPTFRGMRWNLLKTYDKIYTIDLHGNSKKKETAPDGSADINVFDIMQGVSINVFVKTGKKKINELGKVFHCDLFGKREFKYDFLAGNSVNSINFKELPNIAPNYFFVNKDFDSQKSYDKGFKLNEVFTLNNVGIVTSRDGFVTSDSKDDLVKRIKNFFYLEKEEILSNYDVKENNVWKIDDVKQKAKAFEENNITLISYRPFDIKYIYYNNNFIERSRIETMQHLIKGTNVGIVFKLGNAEENSVSAMVSKTIIDFRSWSRPGMQGGDYISPLYLYPETMGQQTIGQTNKRTPNLNTDIVNRIAEKLGLIFTTEKETTNGTFAPIDILDYIYAVLHSPTYREKYKEFLKIDFPRVPYPKDETTFSQLVKLGSEIRQIHLLESPTVEKYITQYPITGDNVVTKPKYQDGKVYINDTQYFNNVPEVAWNFYIGGYQPAQKWLKDRKDRKLEFDDILHYQKIIVALTETDRLMKEIDKIEIE
jgi:predicted helicase